MSRSSQFLVFGLAGVAAFAATQIPTVRARDARLHVGRQIVVHDSVAEVISERQSGFTYLNFGRSFPEQQFTAVIPDSVERLAQASTLLGQWARVTGTPRYGRDSIPEILCENPTQIVAATQARESAPVTQPPPVPPSRSNCCRVCSTGKACGNSCIARSRTCRQPPGCACDR